MEKLSKEKRSRIYVLASFILLLLAIIVVGCIVEKPFIDQHTVKVDLIFCTVSVVLSFLCTVVSLGLNVRNILGYIMLLLTIAAFMAANYNQ
jgi:hypothetical protein